MNLPIDFTNRMKEYLGKEYDAFIASYESPEVKGLRLNTLAPGESLGAICNTMEKVPWCNEGFYYYADDGKELRGQAADSDDNIKMMKIARPGKHPYHEAGAYYIQEPSAMAPVEYLDVKPGDRVLDLCAAPGGKSTQIAAKLKGEGILITNEIMTDRARILSENIERMGVRNALVISEDPRNISDRFAGFFDKILVDAPCSGEGMFRRSDIAINEWSFDNVKLCADRQEWILDEAAKMLSPGGTLVYSTCTFSKEEDEEQVINFLISHEDMILAPMTIYDGMVAGNIYDVSKLNTLTASNTEIENKGIGVRLFPHKLNGEGHYVCKFVKKVADNIEERSSVSSKVPPVCGYEPDISKKDRAELKEMFQFFDEIMEKETESEGDNESSSFLNYMSERRITRFKDQIYLLPNECPSLKGMKVLRPGLHLGTILKNRFEPGHALAMALSIEEVKNACVLSTEGDEIYKYFNGETFNIDDSKAYISIDLDEFCEKNIENKEKSDRLLWSKMQKSGWHVIFVDKFSAGWGKRTNFIMKNHYPKGLRKNLR